MARRVAADRPNQQLVPSWGQATVLQVLGGTVLPMLQHWKLDRSRRAQCQAQWRAAQQQVAGEREEAERRDPSQLWRQRQRQRPGEAAAELPQPSTVVAASRSEASGSQPRQRAAAC